MDTLTQILPDNALALASMIIFLFVLFLILDKLVHDLIHLKRINKSLMELPKQRHVPTLQRKQDYTQGEILPRSKRHG